jgi:hypothetical protein
MNIDYYDKRALELSNKLLAAGHDLKLTPHGAIDSWAFDDGKCGGFICVVCYATFCTACEHDDHYPACIGKVEYDRRSKLYRREQYEKLRKEFEGNWTMNRREERDLKRLFAPQAPLERDVKDGCQLKSCHIRERLWLFVAKFLSGKGWLMSKNETVSGAFGQKPAFKLKRIWRDEYPDGSKGPLRIEYNAGFWHGPYDDNDHGFYKKELCTDVALNGRWLNTAKNVGYYSQMPKAPDDYGLPAPK